jgi:predicted RNA-binding protein
MYYIFVVNDLKNDLKLMSSEEIVDKLLNKKCWLFNDKHPITSRVKKLKQNDKVLLYMAGIHKKSFVASFTLDGESRNIEEVIGLDDKFYGFFRFVIPIKDIKTFVPPISINAIINDLDFINNKEYWGLFFRQSMKAFSENDYLTIINSSQKKEQ